MKVAVKFQVTIIVDTEDMMNIDTREINEEIDSAIDRQIKQSGLIEDGDPSTVEDFNVMHIGTVQI